MELLEYFSSLHRKGVVPVLGYPGLAAEKVSTEECLRDPSLHARVVKTNIELYGPDAALPLLDLSVEAESFGVKPIFTGRSAPQIEEFQRLEDVAAKETAVFANRMALMVETARKISSEIASVPNGFVVVSTGCDILAEASPENIRAFIQTAKSGGF